MLKDQFLDGDYFKFRQRNILKSKTTFLYFWLILEEALSENVVAMATREGLSFLFWFQKLPINIFAGKVTKFQEKIFCSLGVMLQKPQELENVVKF